MSDDRAPVLVGAGQLTQRDVDPAAALEPLAMMVEAAHRAADDAGGGARLLAAADAVVVVNVLSWHYANPPRLLAEQLGVHPREALYGTIGGDTPQWLVNRMADAVAAGRVRLALIAGAEAVATVRRAQRTRTRLRWGSGGGDAPAVVGDQRPGTSDHEVAHGFQLPAQIYPLFENALRAHRGWDLESHRSRLGRLCSRLAAVAAENPHAWFREPRSAEEIATVTPHNRMVGFPYPKYMNAMLEVDQAAALLLTSAGTARELGIPRSRWIHVWGGAAAHDRWFISQRANYRSAPALGAAARRALGAAGLEIGAIDYFDLYSCFPSAVEIAQDELGLPDDDPRALTVTGGLPYFGGPGNGYSLHAIAAMMARLRARPEARGLVTALGWYLTKHAVGVYGAAPPRRPWTPLDPDGVAETVGREPEPPLAFEAAGAATVETYTVMHDREGAPVQGLVIGRLGDGRRFLAGTPDDRALLESLTAAEAVGRRGTVAHRDGVNRFVPA